MTGKEAISIIEDAIQNHWHYLHESPFMEDEDSADQFAKAVDMVEIVAKPVLPPSGC